MRDSWRRALGLPRVKRKATWKDYVGVALAAVPVIVVIMILQAYDVPPWSAAILALAWGFPGIFVASRITAHRERHLDP